VITCPECRRENPDEARFCLACGARFGVTPRPEAREERKIVTVLFADLVGFTSRAERMDPEDVRALLSPYHARLRSELELFGGTVEKFIGDAVMALFGAPIAHEDDPERAVRAALSIRDWVREQEEELQVRIAVNTGEALVALGARPEAGEGMASGDVVNTAARLQAAAPVNGILVGETTWRATKQAIDYGEQHRVDAKGKAEPIPVWEALEARSRLGMDVAQEAPAPLVGREEELKVLRDALSRAQREPSVQLVTLVGVPGIGKSRLVYELMQEIASSPDLVTWRQGRCLPYGEGISFWALGEMVKAQTGVLEADPPDVVASKLDESVVALLDPSEAGWVKRHLGVLAGSSEDGEANPSRDEAFAAWRRYLEALAEQRPTVLVFEDLHWADEGLLDFVDSLVDWASDVPMLVLASARPELLARRPGWGGGKRNAISLSLSRLRDVETSWMIASLLGRSVLPAETQAALLERAEGNPLYAEQYARMFVERGDADDLPVPETLQGIIAARLDALPAAEKELVQNGAVIGKVFWTGAIEAVAGISSSEADRLLHLLDRKEFVRRERRPSLAGESEYAFRHVLVRDVAYSQIPRTARAEKHLRAAEWIAVLGREADHAEMLAYHLVTALELERALGHEPRPLVEKARAALRAAAERAHSLQAFATAATYYSDAMLLDPAEDERLELLFAHAVAAFRSFADDRDTILEQAGAALLGAEDVERAAEVESMLADVWWRRGEHAAMQEHLDRALNLVADRASSAAKARVVGQAARYRMLGGDTPSALALGDEVLAMAENLDLEELHADLLVTIGTARGMSGDPEGVEQMKRGLELALAGNSLTVAARAYHNLSSATFHLDFPKSLDYLAEARRVSRRIGGEASARYSDAAWIGYLCWLGEWDEAMRLADEYIAECEAGRPQYGEDGVRDMRALIRHARGESEGASADMDIAISLARAASEPHSLVPVLIHSGLISLELGRRDEADARVTEVLTDPTRTFLILYTVELATLMKQLGRASELRPLLEDFPTQTPWHQAAVAILDGEYARAADLLEELGIVFLSAHARLHAATAFAASGRLAEANAELRPALAFFRSVGATRYVREAEALLAAAS
jgi:class 3 adenylate cyclase/tetratricopeptide (TPR) repeat protein